jgi:cyclohexyl-isocyanide hydratase
MAGVGSTTKSTGSTPVVTQSFNIGFVLFPKVTQLDFTGPLQVLSRLPESSIHIVASSHDPVPTDCPLKLVPTTTFAESPQLDLLCVPGGFGVLDAMQNPEVLAYVRHQAAPAHYVTSVCTGAFILGRAGLLRGRKATTHWAYTSLLPLVGATHVPERVVRDGNLFTAGGVTSGIDFGLQIVAEIAGDDFAQATQLGIEYDPAPPFASGHPSRAPDSVKALVAPRYSAPVQAYRTVLEQPS